MRLIVDASTAVAWCAIHQATDMTWAAARHVRQFGALVPAHFPTEIANSVRYLLKRDLIDHVRVQDFTGMMLALDFECCAITNAQAMGSIFALANRHDLSIYDAAYLDLALSTGAQLATRDRALAASAATAGVALFQQQ